MDNYKKPWETPIFDADARLFPDELALEAYQKRHATQVKKLGVVVAHQYFETPDQDTLRAFFEDREVYAFGWLEMVSWVTEVALGKERRRLLRLANRQEGTFYDKFGWRVPCLTTNTPAPRDEEAFIIYQRESINKEWENFDDN